MPKQLEAKLKREYGASSAIPYKVMNSLGYMHGSKETAKGKRLDGLDGKSSRIANLRHFAHPPKAKGK